ncbi:MAG: antibiotic biosynthesis monooxygenase [Rhodospirillales bacterium]|jgi:(4S)-4-hydroxy-5-phosphonooxypentane-2,3-dione isomerase|nr:antibiotic biosynthesis monooxygenase [Rhodospirillales bacterium]
MSHRAIVFRAECKPEFRADFIARAQRHAGIVRSEPGCMRCDVLVPQEGGNLIFLYELFEDEAALEAHKEMPYMPGWREDITPMVADRDATFVIVTND